MFTKEQAVNMYPMYEKSIRNSNSDQRWDEIETGRSVDNFSAQFPEDVKNVQEQEYVRGYERYYKTTVQRYRVFEAFSSKEDLLDRQVIVVVNLFPKQIGPFISECLITGFHRENNEVVLAVPDKKMKNGARLS